MLRSIGTGLPSTENAPLGDGRIGGWNGARFATGDLSAKKEPFAGGAGTSEGRETQN